MRCGIIHDPAGREGGIAEGCPVKALRQIPVRVPRRFVALGGVSNYR